MSVVDRPSRGGGRTGGEADRGRAGRVHELMLVALAVFAVLGINICAVRDLLLFGE